MISHILKKYITPIVYKLFHSTKRKNFLFLGEKVWANLSNEHRCKNPKENTKKTNLAIHKKDNA